MECDRHRHCQPQYCISVNLSEESAVNLGGGLLEVEASSSSLGGRVGGLLEIDWEPSWSSLEVSWRLKWALLRFLGDPGESVGSLLGNAL